MSENKIHFRNSMLHYFKKRNDTIKKLKTYFCLWRRCRSLEQMWIARFKSGHFNLEKGENACRASVVDDVHDEKNRFKTIQVTRDVASQIQSIYFLRGTWKFYGYVIKWSGDSRFIEINSLNQISIWGTLLKRNRKITFKNRTTGKEKCIFTTILKEIFPR